MGKSHGNWVEIAGEFMGDGISVDALTLFAVPYALLNKEIYIMANVLRII